MDEMLEYCPKWKYPEFEDPSYDWLSACMKRNEMNRLVGNEIDLKRIEMLGKVGEWFTKIYDPMDLTKYNEFMIGNMGEWMLHIHYRMLSIRKRDSRDAIVPHDENESITILTAVTTNGDNPPPLFVFPLKILPKPIDVMVRAGKIQVAKETSGWVDQATFHDWSIKFFKWIAQRRKSLNLPENAPFLLFVDCHTSNAFSEILKSFKENHIDVVSFPDHASDRLQPLEVGVVAPFKKYFKVWRRKIAKTELKFKGDDEDEVDERTMISAKLCVAAVNALGEAMEDSHVINGFRRSGIWPRDSNQSLRNPRIVQQGVVAVNKRKRSSDTDDVVAEDPLVSSLELEREGKRKKKNSRYIPKPKKDKPKGSKVTPARTQMHIHPILPLPTHDQFKFPIDLSYQHQIEQKH
jgi:hypothetical protein